MRSPGRCACDARASVFAASGARGPPFSQRRSRIAITRGDSGTARHLLCLGSHAWLFLVGGGVIGQLRFDLLDGWLLDLLEEHGVMTPWQTCHGPWQIWL